MTKCGHGSRLKPKRCAISLIDRTPGVSIVIPTYNAAEFVTEAIASALSQTGIDVEVIIVDDASTDGTLELVRKLAKNEPRIQIEALKRNMGPAAARNHGFSVARGAWIAVLDSDDWIAPDRTRRLIDVADRKRADIASDNLMEFANNDTRSAKAYVADAVGRWISAAHYLAEGRLFRRGRDYGYLKPIFRAHAIRTAGLRYNEMLRIGEDDDFVVRALIAGLSYWFEPQETYFYRKHTASTSHRLSVEAATAMCAASAELVASNSGSRLLPLLQSRHSALKRGLDFVRLVAALKKKRLLTAIGTLLRNPRVIPLLRMPLNAAVRKLTTRLSQAPAKEANDFVVGRARSARADP